MPNEPTIHPDFPIRESLSPPHMDPVYDCAEAVHLSAFVPHATVLVYAGADPNPIGKKKPDFGFDDVKLDRRVHAGEHLTATQIVDGVESGRSTPPVVVQPLPSTIGLTRPTIIDALHECARVVPVHNLVPSTQVHAYENGGEVGVAPAATSWVPVVTAPLHKDGMVTAQQFGCEGTDHQIDGLRSDPPVKVRPTPVPVPPPSLKDEDQIPGNDAAFLTGLLVGAEIEVTRGGVVLGGGLATAGNNWVPLNARLTGEKIFATQKLCENVSVPAEATPKGTLGAPQVVGPICAGARHVVVRKTTVNATVVVRRNGSAVGNAGAGLGDVFVELGAGIVLNSGDHITAIQYVGSPGAWTISPVSNTVDVVRRVESPAIEILGGHPFFLPKGEEQPIPGPVFPRGGAGPQIRIQACCQGDVRVRILDANDQDIASDAAEITVTELYPGYYSATWLWKSWTAWTVPDGVPVGRYTVVAHASCTPQQETRAPFFVIFDPAAVGGPPRFTFDATAIWFGAGHNSTMALPYYLHPSDARVFMPAIKAAQGHTDPYTAAHALARAEEALFAYDLSYHGDDVVHLITSQSHAQCADDACCLTAFLRAVGIPAHPVTADASYEHGASWGFDTWVEFLSHHDGALEWRVFHPHEYPGMTAESRLTFGTTRPAALKNVNDIIIMAGDNWVSAEVSDSADDVSFGRNPCLEPSQVLVKSAWVDELCEAGYWAKPHWDCTGVRINAVAPGRLNVDSGALRFGGLLSGTLHLENRGEEALRGPVRVELIGSRPEVKRLAETYAEVSVEAALAPGETVDLPIQLNLPVTLPPGQSLLLRATMATAEAVLPAALEQLSLPVGVEVELEWQTGGLAVGERSTARVVVRNVSDEPVRDVTVDLTAPFAIRAEESQRRLGDLQPGEGREVEWTLRIVAPIDAGSLHVAVATGNSGGALIRRPFRVAEPADSLLDVRVMVPLPE